MTATQTGFFAFPSSTSLAAELEVLGTMYLRDAFSASPPSSPQTSINRHSPTFYGFKSTTFIMRSSMILSQGLRASKALSRTSRPFSQLIFQSPRLSTNLHLSRPPRISALYASIRNNSSAFNSRPLTDIQSDPASDAEKEEQNRIRREQEPAYQITFTCKPCGNRSSHRMSKHGYHRGTVLIRCPSCENRHVISDHLGIFLDQKSTLEDILQKEGKALTKGYLEGDVEFWEDGTVRKSESH